MRILRALRAMRASRAFAADAGAPPLGVSRAITAICAVTDGSPLTVISAMCGLLKLLAPEVVRHGTVADHRVPTLPRVAVHRTHHVDNVAVETRLLLGPPLGAAADEASGGANRAATVVATHARRVVTCFPSCGMSDGAMSAVATPTMVAASMDDRG